LDSVLGLIRHTGNDGLFHAIEMSLLAAAAGQPLHLHAEGLRGTGKTTIMRAVRRVLPRIRRIKGCLYNCDPAHPHCPVHRHLAADLVATLGDEWVPMPFLEVSHSAKIGTVVGSIDLSRLVHPTAPEAALLPGTIPQAHRGIIFIDEINRLAETAPELADILLDVTGTKPGRVQIEETGLPPVELPVQVTVWAASNPDEDPGPLEEIRRQLSDRFDFVLYTDRPSDVSVVEQLLAVHPLSNWHRSLSPADETKAELFRARVAARHMALRSTVVSEELRHQIADLYSRFNVESLRAVQAIHLGIRLSACLDARHEATAEDLARITPLALRHRVDSETMKKVAAHLAGLQTRVEAAPVAPLKPRFSNISFGGAAVEPLTAPPTVEEGRSVEWATQFPPRPPAPNTPDDRARWFDRALDGIRKNLGVQAPARRPELGNNASGQALGGRESSLTPPRPGRLFQQVDASQPGGEAADQRQQAADPRTMPRVAPPHAARPIDELDLHELIRTEEELGRG
jgi:magnesium chelatase subunit I